MVKKHSRVSVRSMLTAVSSNPVGSGKTHPLSVLDHAMGLHTVHVVFYYRKNPFGIFDVDPLRIALSEVLCLYPQATGRLTRGESGNWLVKCNDAGVRVLRAKVEATMDEWLRSADGSEEKDLTFWEEIPEEPSTWSPFRIQVNEFEGGGVAFGLSCTHMNADPTSITILFKSWIESHRQEPIEHPPLFKSTTLHHQQVPNTSTKPDNYYATKGNAETPSVKMVTATFKFSDSAIKKWLDEVRDQCAKATPFDLLAALFWTRVAHLKAPKNDNKHSLSICLDFRRLVQPPIPLGYFGNALHFSLLTLDEEEMDYGKLGHVVELVHRHVSDVGEEEVWSVVDWFESQKEEGGKYAQPFTMYGPELTCVSMEHMILGHKSLMFSASFKSDEKPVHVACHVGNVRGEGLIVVLPSVEEGLARTVMVTLPEEEMPKLCEDQAIQCLQPTLLIGGR
ncbi:protein ECERIFERUM 26-like isoform X1 [Populus alba x Populus x berolinensis]|nr:protein ECERIFERUM 26-like isoform X1 [Populus alba x Populus x berolinensis]